MSVSLQCIIINLFVREAFNTQHLMLDNNTNTPQLAQNIIKLLTEIFIYLLFCAFYPTALSSFDLLKSAYWLFLLLIWFINLQAPYVYVSYVYIISSSILLSSFCILHYVSSQSLKMCLCLMAVVYTCHYLFSL